jgi:hypothetical protein
MKLLLGWALGLGIATMSTAVHAQNYPWCAYYGGGQWGENCGFTTYQQCKETVSGVGGSCDRNTQYVPPPGPHPAAVHRHRSPH